LAIAERRAFMGVLAPVKDRQPASRLITPIALEPLTHSTAARAAEHIVNLRLKHRILSGLPAAWRPTTMTEGYLIQGFAHRYLIAAGYGPVAGYKIGCTTPVMRRKLGIDHPCAGAIFGSQCHEGRADLLLADFHKPFVECEIALRLGADLPADDAPASVEALAGAVDCCMAAIELVDDRYEDAAALGPAILTADDFYCGGCVLGPAISDWRRLDLAAARGRILINGEVKGEGVGADVMGHPLNAVAWLMLNLRARGESLRAGQVVLTGSFVRSEQVTKGDQVTIAIDGLGEVQARYH
jgi:2-oxo-3-hexenedioate decarboxylase/2-keto-4-pentenoate hydratase